jgi:REP element-mobilizing transposase RayT
LEFPGAVYHVTSRGDRREPIFFEDEDREAFLSLLGREVSQQGWRLYAYCLMDNHYHLLVETPEPNLSRGMRRLNGVYTQTFNRRHGLVGHLFQGRYKAIVVDRDSYLLELSRYVVLNPVRAGRVENPADWVWSSYGPTVGAVPAPTWLAAGDVLRLFGKGVAAARQAYARFVLDGVGKPSPWAERAGQMFLGDEAFLRRMETLAAEQPAEDIPERQRCPIRPDRQRIVEEVAKTYGVAPSDVLDRASGSAFKAAVYLLRREANLSLKEVAVLAGVSCPRISQIQRELDLAPDDKRLRRIRRAIK